MFGTGLSSARLRSRKEAVLQRTRASRGDWSSGVRSKRKIQIVAAAAATLGILSTGLVTGADSPASAGTVGSGFTVDSGDLMFILKQIKIAERHALSIAGRQDVNSDGIADPGFDGSPPNPHSDPNDPLYDPQYCTSLVGPNADQIPDALTSYGLRLVDGGCNNLVESIAGVNGDSATPGVARPNFARADQPFPRLTKPLFRDTEAFPDEGLFTGSTGSGGDLTYASTSRGQNVFDTQPRVVSNLIVDQTSANPAAVEAAANPVRTQGATGSAVPCTSDPIPALSRGLSDPGADPPGGAQTPGAALPRAPPRCTPSHKTLFIPTVTPDVGLSPPYNAFFTFFGQFFDHGVDQTVKSGAQVIIPLNADDPLVLRGPDGIAGNGDEVKIGGANGNAYMSLPRAENQPGPDGVLGTNDDVHNANNTDTPWVDQSQTYTSHPAHQVFLREYTLDANQKPHATGKFLDGLPAGQTYPGSPDGAGGIGTWAATKKQAAEKLGLKLLDGDIDNVPMVAADVYGNFIPGPQGFAQWVTTGGLVEGNPAAPVPTPDNVLHFDTPFLTEVNGRADPGPGGNCLDAPNAGCKSPDTNTTVDIKSAPPDSSHYDNELLDSHFICGDGRCNENIALSTVHQIFHSEHNRLVDDENSTLDANASLKADYLATNCASSDCATHDPNKPQTFTTGERMFQAARFVTEMEYQHLVFEEFARKIQPAVRPFHLYNADINSAIPAEYAHAVYRFGHSMLNDEVVREDRDANNVLTDNSVPLLTAFLTPPLFFNNSVQAGHPVYSAREAAGAIVMGTADQTGNELDEFVAETLRNNLLGQPLDLTTLNISRGRDTGIPPLNVLRRQIFKATNDGQLAPYTDWSDYGQHLKHPASLINFVAAYGQHPSILAETTTAGKRAKARAIVDPLITDTVPLDAAAFMFGTVYPGPDGVAGNDPTTPQDESADDIDWRNTAAGVTTTGVDLVDAWVGGLAEVTDLFGGLLGTTMNYVFEHTLENLQDGDRLYYLARTPGMNLRTQLEGNSFAELIMRNTDGTNSLKADAFATADCKFQLGAITFPAVAGSAITGPGSVNDVGTANDGSCDENRLLLRQTNGTISYRSINSVDPSGINGQAVYNGTDAADRVAGGNDNDTFWGGPDKDVIEGNGGDDVILGGLGNDIETDLSGADVLKGGPDNDALDGGIGDDIFMGGDGSDFINGGANDNEAFAGDGNDFIIAGQGADAAQGDGGDDWIQGGSGQDLLIGDHSAPFFDDPAESAPGNDVFLGQVGENDYDAEGGDDIMAQNAAVDRNAGAGGFDWAIHQYDTVGADDDMAINNFLVGAPIQVVVNRDRWQETEADSGSKFNDVIRGTDDVPSLVGGAGFTGCDALDQKGLDRISGLDALVPSLAGTGVTAADVAARSASGVCPLTGPVWG